jgi:hypothetical protein
VERPDGALLAIKVKAASSAMPGDFKHLRFLRNALPSHFVRGIVLYQGERVVRFDEDLYAVPLPALWEL